MFVMKTGICQHPPLQWPQEVLAAAVFFPYILTLQSQLLSVYSMVDQQNKQTVSLRGAKGLLSTSGKPGSTTSSPNPGRLQTKKACQLRFCLGRCSCVFHSALIQSIIHMRIVPVFLKTQNKSPYRWRASVHRERHFQPPSGAISRANPGTYKA